jgi:hypothetical protein
MLEAPPHSHGHRTPLFPLYCGRQPHRRHHHRGHSPPCRGPTAIGHRRSNSPHPRDPLHPPVLHHRFPAKEPDPRRRTAAGLVADRTPVEPPLPPCRQRRQSLPLSGVRAHATAPSTAVAPHSWANWAASTPARALAPGGPKSPPAQLAGNSFFFFFSHFFSPFSYIYVYLYADILCTKNSLNKL